MRLMDALQLIKPLDLVQDQFYSYPRLKMMELKIIS
jgi:hypothetical protein